MSDDLLAKEKEFHKLNQELQLKKYDVMKKMSFFTHANTTNESFNNIKQYINPTMKDVRTTYLRDKTSSTDKQLRKSSPEVSEVLSIENIADTEISLKKYNNLGNEAIIKLLKGKIDMLYKELQTIQHEYNNECGYSKELEVKNKKLNETQVKLHSQIGSLSDTITKLQDINHDILSKYQGLSNENIVLKKDLHNLNKKIKISHKQSFNCDIRLNRSLENNEKLRSMLKSSQVEEKQRKCMHFWSFVANCVFYCGIIN
ncbi:uncharacterized protein LOC116844957 isoform X3 [Odontomachus brunneus]|uniref:uncharacterized protein LOC116844957 isoform X3 n=1 Tax=Odontomachus brunneus TaxID=486640 RepID=UPI0013F26034|nr:uncharacterized protein LOC116844957 isoform X3 [Odontomachus brunneus]